jgi:NAD(P)-dependent dehydrogenase (short-subunit alcohol dehydrogenase family)
MLGERGESHGCDIADPSDIARLMSAIKASRGHIDILVISAGVSNAPDIGDLTTAAYARLMDVNCRGAVFTFVEALPLLVDGGSVVFVGSVAGLKGQPGDALYAGSKGFIRALALNAGTDPSLMARNIRVNVVSPGPTETPLTQAATADDDIRAYVEGLIPMAAGAARRKWPRRSYFSRQTRPASPLAPKSLLMAAWRMAEQFAGPNFWNRFRADRSSNA